MEFRYSPGALAIGSRSPVDGCGPAPKPAEPPVAGTPTPKKLRPVAELSSVVKERRFGGQDGGRAIEAMDELLEQWSPVGKPVAEVKTILGQPALETPESILYQYGHEMILIEITLRVQSGIVASLSGSAND